MSCTLSVYGEVRAPAFLTCVPSVYGEVWAPLLEPVSYQFLLQTSTDRQLLMGLMPQNVYPRAHMLRDQSFDTHADMCTRVRDSTKP